MWCAYCLNLVLDPKFHRDCQEQLWLIQSEEYTKLKTSPVDWPEGMPVGCTVDVQLLAEYNEKRRQLIHGGGTEKDLAALKQAYSELWN